MDSQTFLDNFGIIADAPGGIESVREFILDLATRGELSDQIQNEMQPAFTEEVGPYEIPRNWTWTRLDQIADYNGRPNLKPSEISPTDWVLDLEDIEKSTSRLLHRVYASNRKTTSNKSTFQPGDVLYGKLRPYLDKVLVADAAGCCTTEIVPIIPKDGIDSEWLRISLKSPQFRTYVNARSYGMKMPRLGTKDAVASLHAVPPFAEQRRIVKRVQELMSLCDDLDAAKEKQDSLRTLARKSAIDAISTATTPDDLAVAWTRISEAWLMLATSLESITSLRSLILDLAMLGKLGTQDPSEEVDSARQLKSADEIFPSNWKLITFNDGCDIEGGNQPQKSKFVSEAKPGYVRLYQIRDYGKNPVPTFIPKESTSRFSSEGDILIGRYGASIGKIFRAAEGAYNVALAKFIYPRDLFSSEYMYWVLRTSRCQQVFTKMTRSAQAGFNKKDLASLVLPCPPLKEQERITRKLASLMGLCDELESALQTRLTIQQSLATSAAQFV